MARREIKSHKKATNLNLTDEMEKLLGMKVGSDSMKLKSADDLSEPDEELEDENRPVAAIEATINYVNKLLNESDEELDLPEDDEELPENPEDKVADDEEAPIGDNDETESDEKDDVVDECNGAKPGKKFMCEDDDADVEDVEKDDDDEEDDSDNEDEAELGDMEDEDPNDEDFDDEDFDDDDDMDDVTESFKFLFEDDDALADDDKGLSIDIPEDMDPNDVSVSVGGSEYVPETDDKDDEEDGKEEDLGDLADDKLEDKEDDTPVQESFYPFLEEYFQLGEDDDPDVEDVEPKYDDKDFDDEEETDKDKDNDEEETPEEEEVTESAVMRALRRLMKEGERSDDPITADPSTSTGDAPVDTEDDVDDSAAEEDDLKGDEGEVDDADIPITPGTIQPEEAAELKWMMKKLRKIMEGDDLESHSDDDGKVVAEPLDDKAEEMIGDMSEEISDDGELTDTGNGAVDDSEITLGTPEEADKDVEVEGDDVVSSNGKKYDEKDEDDMLTDNYHMLMTAIKEAYAKKKAAKKDKKAALKKVDKKKDDKKKAKKKKVSESVDPNLNTTTKYPETQEEPMAVGPEKYKAPAKAPVTEGKMKTLEDTVLGSFNKQEMTSVLRNLNNAFGSGRVAVEVRDSSIVSEVSVPKWSLPIAENATWDSLKAGKLLSETAYKSESKVDFDLMKKSHLYWENEGLNESDYKFPIASIVEGKAQIIPEAITEATNLFASPSFITRFSESSLKKIRNVLDFYNTKMGKTSPWKENKQLNVTEAAKITMIDRTNINPLAVLKRLSEQEKAKKLINLRG